MNDLESIAPGGRDSARGAACRSRCCTARRCIRRRTTRSGSARIGDLRARVSRRRRRPERSFARQLHVPGARSRSGRGFSKSTSRPTKPGRARTCRSRWIPPSWRIWSRIARDLRGARRRQDDPARGAAHDRLRLRLRRHDPGRRSGASRSRAANVWVKRPGTGEIKARDFDRVLGRRATRAPANTQVRWSDVV